MLQAGTHPSHNGLKEGYIFYCDKLLSSVGILQSLVVPSPELSGVGGEGKG